MTMLQDIPTICRMCEQGCGMVVTVENGRPVKVKGSKNHPYNQGWLCAKGRASLDFFYSPERLTSPLIKKEGKFVAVEWEQALDFAARKLQNLKDRHGPQSLAIYHGEGTGHQEIKSFIKRFANVFGTPNFSGVGSICNEARTLGEKITYGAVTRPDISNTGFMLIWGANPFVSHEPVLPRDIARLKKRGILIALVDPRKTETAAKADFHLALKPGRDEILLLNMMHVIFREELWDRAFTEHWVHGFAPFFEAVIQDRFSPEKGEPLTGVDAELVRTVARLYGKTKPASAAMGNGLDHHTFGVNAIRLLAIMKAVTGNLDIPGGDLFTPRPKIKDITSPLPSPSVPPLGSKEFPFFCKMRKEARALSIPEAILDEHPYPIKGMIIAGGNTTVEWPDSNRVRKALKKLEFLMVIDVVRSPDCEYADLILPASTFFERDEHRVNVYLNLAHITLRRQAVKPLYGLPDQMIWVKLAKAMGFGEYFPWQTCSEAIDYLLSDLGLSYEALVSRGGLYEYEKRTYRKYETQGFSTPTGKVEILSESLRAGGYDPSPVRDTVLHSWGEDKAFPLVLTTGANLLPYLHWQYRYIPKLRKLAPEPLFEVHPQTALEWGIEDRETAEVRNANGKIRLKAHVTEKIRPDTIHIPQGWEEANANELSSGESPDPISGFPNLKSLRCRIEKI
ncbi:MAG: molybdopterin-dependent oxidoreductase [Deltaproteobacteria bacterium]|nr:molybdopterin-dependent oxidoreductase [Deltaproteobacteria bacterium]